MAIIDFAIAIGAAIIVVGAIRFALIFLRDERIRRP